MKTPAARDVYARDLRLRLWDHGGEGPTVLFLHGYLDTGRSFDAVAELLADDVRAVCLDWRGHGQSACVGAGGSYHLLDHVKDLASVVAALGETGAAPDVIVAHSMGGNVALLFAGALPEEMQRLLLVDALGGPPEAPEEQPERLASVLRAAKQLRPFQSFSDVNDAVARLRAMNPGLSEQGARRMAEPVLVRADDGALRFPFDPRLKGPTPVRWPEEMWLSLCRRVTARVKVLRAEHGYLPADPLVSARLDALAAELETVADAHHHLHVERPDVLAHSVRALLSS